MAKSAQILIDELKKAGIAEAEATAEVFVKTIFEKILPQLAMTADEPVVKGAAAFLLPFAPMIEDALMKLSDKIDPNT